MPSALVVWLLDLVLLLQEAHQHGAHLGLYDGTEKVLHVVTNVGNLTRGKINISV